MSFRLHALAVGMAASLAMLSAPAHAEAVLTGLSAVSSASLNGTPGSTVTESDVGYVGSNSRAGSFIGGEARASAWANQHGWYGVGASADYVGSASARSTLRYTITNDTSESREFTSTFRIFGASVSAMADPTVIWGDGEFLQASYEASFRAGGQVLFESGATIRNDEAGIQLSLSGTRLNDYGADGASGLYLWDEGTYSVSLGVLAAGASIDFEVDVLQTAISNYTIDHGGLGESCGLSEFGNCGRGRAGAQFGDPFGFDSYGQGSTLVSFDSTVAADPGPAHVPEPASLALAGLGLLAAGMAGRRRKA
jgi:PEP-CTERM motif